MSSPLPCGTPSAMSNRTTSPSSFSPTRWASVPPICPAPTSAIFFRAMGDRSLLRGGVLSCELTQDVVQDATVAEVLDLVERIDPAHERHFFDGAVRGRDLSRQLLTRLQVARQPADRDGLVALQPKARPRRVALEHERRHAHADEVRAVDALKALRDNEIGRAHV